MDDHASALVTAARSGRRMPQALRVCYVATSDISLRFLLLRQMQHMQRAGFDVMAVSSDGPYVHDVRAAGIPVHVVRMHRPIALADDLRALVQLVCMFRKLAPDIVHTHTPKAGVLGRVAARVAGVPIVVHTDFGLYFMNTSRFARGLFLLLECVAARFAQSLLFEDPTARDFAVARHMAPASRALWIGGGIDLSTFRACDVPRVVRDELRTRAGFGADAFVIGFVGRMVRGKGVLDLLDAMQIAVRANPRIRLVLIGPEDERARGGIDIADAIARRELGGIAVQVPVQRDIRPWYSMMDAFALPTYRDSWPRSPMEACAMGLPLVITDLPGVRIAVRCGENGMVVPVGDVKRLAAALTTVAAMSCSERAVAARVSRQIAESLFDERSVFDRVQQVYAELESTQALQEHTNA